jgi:hypothetical protein
MRVIISFLVGVVLMGCSYADDKKVSECKAEEYQYLIGENIENINNIDFESKVRIIKPNMMVDRQFIPQRLNIRVDEEGKIERIYCG